MRGASCATGARRNAGHSLRGQRVNPGKDLAPYVQAALDEVEYVNGDVLTKWGAQLAKDGHPKPFPLHFIGIGNEDFFDKSVSYNGRIESLHGATYQATNSIEQPEDVSPEQATEIVTGQIGNTPFRH